MVKDCSRACQRERGKKKEEEGKKAQKKPLRRDWDLNPQTPSPEPCVLYIRPRCPAQGQILVWDALQKVSVGYALVEDEKV